MLPIDEAANDSKCTERSPVVAAEVRWGIEISNISGIAYVRSRERSVYRRTRSQFSLHTHDLTLGFAFGLGALHALEPGHGKTAILAYFAGERKSLIHPLIVGISSAVSHSVSLIAIAATVHLTHHLITGDHHHEDASVTQTLQWISAGLVVGVGLWMTWAAWKAKPTVCGCKHHRKSCEDSKKTERLPRTRASLSMSALLGIAFGLLPCPSAMAAYFSGISHGSPMAAYAVIGLFAAGIATSLTLVGMLVQVCGERLTLRGSRLENLPWAYIRAVLITCVGMFYMMKVATA